MVSLPAMASRRFDPELLLIGKLLRLLAAHPHSISARVTRYLADRYSEQPAYEWPKTTELPEEPAAEPTPLPLFPADVAGTVVERAGLSSVTDDAAVLSGITVTVDSGAISVSNPPATTWKDGIPF